MGYIKHHAIAVTSMGYNEADRKMEAVHRKAEEIFGLLVTPIVDAIINGYKSFFIAPDGSKEGWEESDTYDVKRKELTDYIESMAYDDGSNPIKYAVFYYGEDYGNAEIEAHN